MPGVEVDTASTLHILNISGYVYPQASDVSAAADIFVVAASPGGWFMRNTAGNFVPWTARVPDLVPAYEDVTLTAQTHVHIHAGPLPFDGVYALYLGYMRTDGSSLVYIDTPAPVEVSAP
jgi:hypothetical protein